MLFKKKTASGKGKKSVDKDKKSTSKGGRVAAMRNPAVYVLAIIVLVVIIVAFIFGPALSGVGVTAANSAPIFGTYRGRNIAYMTGTFFVRAYEGQYQQVQNQAQQAGREPSLQDAYTAIRNAYDSTVFRFGLLAMAEDSGLIASTEEITQTIADLPQFRDENGEFSSTLLRQTLNSDPGIRDEVEDDIVFAKVRSDLFDDAALSDAEIQFITDTGKNRRLFDIASFSFDSYPQSELISYAQENSTIFQRVELSSITSNTTTEAAELLDRLNNRESSFEDLARASSIDIYAEEGGSRGQVWYNEIQQDFDDESTADILFGLAPGQVSEIFQIRGERYVIFRADSAIIQADPEDPDLVEQARNHVLTFERGRISDYFRAEAENFIARSEEIGWASAAIDLDIAPVTSSETAINYGDSPLFPTLDAASSGVLAGASTRESLFIDIFSLEEGELSEAVELRDKIVVMRYSGSADQDDSQDNFLNLYLPILAQNYLNDELSRQFANPDLLRDSFDATFQAVFLQDN